ncbi:hypothetical protein [Aquella oligotrophica]|nr:hypothetical protein [Aquella oligotrophica]
MRKIVRYMELSIGTKKEADCLRIAPLLERYPASWFKAMYDLSIDHELTALCNILNAAAAGDDPVKPAISFRIFDSGF